MTANDFFAHCRRRTIGTLTDTPRPMAGLLALASAFGLVALLLPYEILDSAGYETLRSWRLTDNRCAVLYAFHLFGTMRMIFKRVERHELDFWVMAVGIVIFSLPPLTLMHDLTRPTLLGMPSLGLALAAIWVALLRNRMPSVELLRRREEAGTTT